MKSFQKQFMDCYFSLDDHFLIIGNSCLERIWDVAGDIPIIVSLKNKATQKEWLTTEDTYDWLDFPDKKYAFYHSSLTHGKMQILSVDARIDDDFGVAEKHLCIQVTMEYEDCFIRWIHIIYPAAGVLRSFIETELKEGVILPDKPHTSRPPKRPHMKEISDDFQDSYPLKPIHCSWKSIRFCDITDDFENLVDERHGLLHRRERNFLKGNLCFVKDVLAQEGLTIIKEGPTPVAYLGGVESDFFIKGMNIFTTGWGFNINELNRYRKLTTYGSTVLLWKGGEEEMLFSLHKYHTSIHVFRPDKDAFVMSNTWGDMSADGKISEEFLLAELETAKETGISLYQIDDGWQNGTSCNSVLAGGAGEMGYYKHDPEFWTVNKRRFPNGLGPIIASGKEKGIQLGVWFGPDSDNDFENWEKDSNVLIDLYKEQGIRAFKLDGIRYTSKAGEENVTRMLQRVIRETDGDVLFNMDVTAGIRSGYFGKLQYSSLFLENRFTGKFGAHPNYFPHHTLRHIWLLSRYYPTFRLQANYLNVARNAELYPDDPLSPATCGIEYSFATTMFANPLSWMEQTGLDEKSVEILHRIVPEYRKIQADILSGHVLPIGEEPDGTVWTGFQSVKSDSSGYILLLKERNFENRHFYKLWNVKGKTLLLKHVLGYGNQEVAHMDDHLCFAFCLEGQFRYVLYQYTVQ